MARSILFKGATLLIHDAKNRVIPTASDLLVEGSKIAKIENNIAEPSGCKVVDARDKIISPGFIDTHRHMWQTQLKGIHGNHSFFEYVPPGLFGGSVFSSDDAFWGQLGGALESLDAGTTMVLDHSHILVTPEHGYKAIQATASSGLRSIWCYTQSPSVKSFDPFEMNDTSKWFKDTFDKVLAAAPWGDGRVTLGYGFDANHKPEKAVKESFESIRKTDVKVVTGHGVPNPMFGKLPAAVEQLDRYGVLGPDIVISHATFPDPKDGERLAKSGAFISSTPSTELQMGLGETVGLRPETMANASLGIDCHSSASASIVGQMNLLLQHQRAKRHDELAKDWKWARSLRNTTEEVFNLGTINGARAVNMENEIGKLQVGMKADLVVFDAMSPGMINAAEMDPVSAIVLHSSVRDIDMVLVDGIVRKEDGKLLDIDVAPAVEESPANVKHHLTWKDVAQSLKESRARIMKVFETIDMKAIEEMTLKGFGLNKEGMVDS